eukprot:1134317-Pelagomonas_calceolata.AAC.3
MWHRQGVPGTGNKGLATMDGACLLEHSLAGGRAHGTHGTWCSWTSYMFHFWILAAQGLQLECSVMGKIQQSKTHRQVQLQQTTVGGSKNVEDRVEWVSNCYLGCYWTASAPS